MEKQVRLNLFSGEKREGYVNIDINPDTKPDIVANVVCLNMYADGTVDEVVCSHGLEHLFPHELVKAVKEIHRVLKPSGKAYFSCPNIHWVYEDLKSNVMENGKNVNWGFYDNAIYGNKRWVGDEHKSHFYPLSLKELLVYVGFTVQEYGDEKMSECVAVKK